MTLAELLELGGVSAVDGRAASIDLGLGFGLRGMATAAAAMSIMAAALAGRRAEVLTQATASRKDG